MHSGIAGGADVILIPERPVDMEQVCEEIRRRCHSTGRTFRSSSSAKAASFPRQEQGEVDQFGHKLLAKRGVGETIGDDRGAPASTEVAVLGHVAGADGFARRTPTTSSPNRSSWQPTSIEAGALSRSPLRSDVMQVFGWRRRRAARGRCRTGRVSVARVSARG